LKSPWQKIKGEWCCNASELRFYDEYPDGTKIDMSKLNASLGIDDGFNSRTVASWSTYLKNGRKVTIFNDRED
jgi:hypothetical protein